MRSRSSLVLVAIAAAALGLVACGHSDNPASPSGSGGVTLEGVLLSEGAAFTASDDDGSGSSGGPITVEVVGTGLSVTISGNGTFKIEDIPEGGITLRFLQDGVELAVINIPYAAEGTIVKIVVKKEGEIIVLVDLDMDDDDDDNDDDPDSGTTGSCMIDGGRVGDRIELEGNVHSGEGKVFDLSTNRAPQPVDIDARNAEFKCNGNTQGDKDECWQAVEPGAKVHVRGTLEKCGTGDAEVTATQVKVQKAA
jgi:hypothetical protein